MSIKQQHRFFLLANKLGYDKQDLIKAAEEKYGKKFMEISVEEMIPLIDILEKELKALEKIQQSPVQEEPKHDFPNEWRYWNKTQHEMINSIEIMPNTPFAYFNDPDYHWMQWTGKVDDNGKKIFDFDYVKSYVGKLYLVQWSWKDCAWVGYDQDNPEFPDESIYLASFGKLQVVGNVYEGVKK